MAIRIKEGVSLDQTHLKVWFAISMAARVWEQLGAKEMWITAAHEQGHKTNLDPERQFHWLPDGTCQAFDVRTKNLKDDLQKMEARRILASILGKEYDVILEHLGEDIEHMHIQYDPQRLGTMIG